MLGNIDKEEGLKRTGSRFKVAAVDSSEISHHPNLYSSDLYINKQATNVPLDIRIKKISCPVSPYNYELSNINSVYKRDSIKESPEEEEEEDIETTTRELLNEKGEKSANDKTEYGHTYYKRLQTYETLPNVEHYKNIFSMIKTKGRPSLTELHNRPRLPDQFMEGMDPLRNGLNGGSQPYGHYYKKGGKNGEHAAKGKLIANGGIRRIGSDKERGISQGPKFGWIKGVLVRCMLNIWGVMLFLRLSWVVGQAGISLATVIVLLSVVVTTITSMSMSAICTNGDVKGGGAYYMISRSLGPEFGGAIGIIFSLANAVAVSMYIVGFAETVLDLMNKYSGTFGISETNWIRIIGCGTAIVLLGISLAGMEWEAKAQIALLFLLIIAIFNFMIGSFLPPKNEQKVKGFFGYKVALFNQNFAPAFTVNENFFSVFSIFFPAATGILAGANISGDLKNAQKAIPKGTFLAILITTSVYLVLIWVLGFSVLREASGNVSDLFLTNYKSINQSISSGVLPDSSTLQSNNRFIAYANQLIRDLKPFSTNGTMNALSHKIWPTSLFLQKAIVHEKTENPITQHCYTNFINNHKLNSNISLQTTTIMHSIAKQHQQPIYKCSYGLLNDYQIVDMISLYSPITIVGIFSATLSSALASLVGAPKVFQALCRDNLFPGIRYFGVGSKRNDEPYRAYILAFTIAVLFILVAELNVIAPIISNFFLMAYALINYSCFDASISKSIGFRPSFKYFNKWVSLFGSGLCLATMFLIQWWAAFLTFFFVISFYAYVRYKKPDVNWGSSTQAHSYKNALTSVLKLNTIEEHVKNFRPQILALTGDPKSRPAFLDFVNNFTKNISLLICGQVIIGQSNDLYFEVNASRVYSYFKHRKVKAIYNPVVSPYFRAGVKSLLQLSGLGRLRPNILMLGYKNNWESDTVEALDQYFMIIHDAFDMRFGVGILRLKDGLDYSFYTNQYHIGKYSYRSAIHQQNRELEEQRTKSFKVSTVTTPRISPEKDGDQPVTFQGIVEGDDDNDVDLSPVPSQTGIQSRALNNPLFSNSECGDIMLTKMRGPNHFNGGRLVGSRQSESDEPDSDQFASDAEIITDEDGDDNVDGDDDDEYMFDSGEDEFDDLAGEERKKNRSELLLNVLIAKPFKRVVSGIGLAAITPTSLQTTNKIVNETGVHSALSSTNINVHPNSKREKKISDIIAQKLPMHGGRIQYRRVFSGINFGSKNGSSSTHGVYDPLHSSVKHKKSGQQLNPQKNPLSIGVKRSASNILFNRKNTRKNPSISSSLGVSTQLSQGAKNGKRSNVETGSFNLVHSNKLRNTNDAIPNIDTKFQSSSSKNELYPPPPLGDNLPYRTLETIKASPCLSRDASKRTTFMDQSGKEEVTTPPKSPDMDKTQRGSKDSELTAQGGTEDNNQNTSTSPTKRRKRTPKMLYNKHILASINQFHRRQRKGFIDVWWLFDDGGLTILLPYIISQRQNWENCKMRFFALSKDKKDLDIMHHNFGAMLTKFRIDYSDVIILPDIHKKPKQENIDIFHQIIGKYRVTDENDHRHKPGVTITEAEYIALEQKSHRHIRLHELLQQYSKHSNLIVLTLPIPRKGTCSAALYMGWLEIMTKDLPPTLLLRGNQQSVLTFYS